MRHRTRAALAVAAAALLLCGSAVAADMGMSLLVTLNGLRLQRSR